MRQIRVKMEDSTWLKRKVFDWGLKVGLQVADLRFAGQPVPPGLKLLHRFFHFALYRLIQDRLGFLRLRKAYTAGAALGPDVFRFFHALGINLKQGYGQTETAGIFCFHRDGDIKFETVGTPFPGVDVRVSDKGEILVRGDIVCRGYYRRDDEPAPAGHPGHHPYAPLLLRAGAHRRTRGAAAAHRQRGHRRHHGQHRALQCD